MPPSLSPNTARKIRRRLDRGDKSKRAIARECGVPIAFVNRVIEEGLGEADPPERATTGEGHCPTCGTVVLLPCLLCELRAMMEVGIDHRQPSVGDGGLTLGLELSGEELERYQDIRKRKQLAGEMPL